MILMTSSIKTAIDRINPAVKKNPKNQICKSVEIKKSGGDLKFRANSLEIEIETSVHIESDDSNGDDKTWLVSGDRIKSISQSLNHDKTQISPSKKGDRLDIKSPNMAIKLNTIPSELPSMVIDNPDFLATVSSAVLADALSRIADFAAKGDVRAYLNGVCVQFGHDTITMVSTNGHALAKIDITASTECDAGREFIIGHDACRLITGYKSENYTRILGTKNIAWFQFDFLQMRSSLIDAKYPEWRHMLVVDERISIIVDKKSLSEMLRTAKSISDSVGTVGVTLTIEQDSLTIESSNTSRDEYIGHIDIAYSGNKMQFGISANYLDDAISKISEDAVEIFVPDDSNSALVQPSPQNDSNQQYLIMPMLI